MQVIIAGDLAPTKSNFELFNNADIMELFGEEILSSWFHSDFRIFNLETPLTDIKNPILKCGPNLIAPTSTINGISALKPSLITIANNHILDQGSFGLESTQEAFQKERIPYIGAGEDLYRASRPYTVSKGGLSIGIYACTEHEFSIASTDSSGANPFDPLESPDQICSLKEKSDFVIVLYHGGKEHYRYPSPHLRKVCRKIADKGADVVICQHSHCIGSYEKYKNATIVYGQGNFLFDKNDTECWKTSLLVKIDFDKSVHIEYLPMIKKNHCVRLAKNSVKDDILNDFKKQSAKIIQKGFIEQRYAQLAQENYALYLNRLSGRGKIFMKLDSKLFQGGLLKKKFSKRKRLIIQNYIECEAHRELLLAGLKGENNFEDKRYK